jgi:uncharacterized protein Yka (UPF0111/DUF47 family)
MATKASMIDVLDEPALLLPQKLEAALVANDRLKLCFTLLQAAEEHAEHPEGAVPDLSAELHAACLDGELLALVAGARREPDESLHMPGVLRVRQLIVEDIAAMLAPLLLAGVAQAKELRARERALVAALPALADERVPSGLIAAVTSAGRGSGQDSLHRLVMDTHKALNSLQGSLSEESLDGARVWRVEAQDRPLIQAFMAGLNETAKLKFEHPGLGTTATRSGQQLLIQNDIGTTDAHVLVLKVERLTATLTYTDIHRSRVAFFQSLFKPLPVRWTTQGTQRSEKLEAQDYYLTVARFEADDRRALERYLTFLGSRIVFLIDWNRARKRLREFLPKSDGVRLLKWAADCKIGHRGFLQLGGERLLYEAMEFAQPTTLRYGEKLHEILGTEEAYDYLQFVFRESTTGLLQGRSERFIRDEIKAELGRRFRSVDASLLGIALTHAERVFDLAAGVADALARCSEPQAAALLERTAQRARQWEREADAIVTRVRSLAGRTAKPEIYARLLHEADDAADGLEDASFLMTHLAAVAPPARLLEPMQTLAALLVAGTQEQVKMFEAARHVTRAGEREDLKDFFASVDRVVAIESETDAAERAVTSALLTSDADMRTFHLLSRLAQVLEESADGLAHTALQLRDHLLDEVMRP